MPVWGEFGSDRPLILAIRGAYPVADHLADLSVPGHDLALLHLPGFHSPMLKDCSMAGFIAAFDEVIRARFAGRDITALGVSTGALAALGLTSPEVRRVLAVEPFFATAKLWALVELFQIILRDHPNDRAFHRWLHQVLGIGPTGVEDRSYDWVLARNDRPAAMLVGSEPLNPRRPVRGLPSLTDDSDRARLPYTEVPGGHDVPTPAIVAALVNLLEASPGPA